MTTQVDGHGNHRGDDDDSQTVSGCTNGNSSSRCQLSSVFRSRILLPCVATINTPTNTMVLCLLIVFWVLSLWSSSSAVMMVYLIHCITDRKPRSAVKPYLVQIFERRCHKAWFFRWTAEYFPCRLVLSRKNGHNGSDGSGGRSAAAAFGCDDDDGPYIFAYHPHGVIGMGVNMALNTNSCGFEEMFPGIRHRSGVTLNAAFCIPFFREWILLNGFCSADRSTLKSRLTSNKRESLVIVPGGAREALLAKPKTMKLALKDRKGFIKLAMETGVPVVPVLGFGENDVFDTVLPQVPSCRQSTMEDDKKGEGGNDNGNDGDRRQMFSPTAQIITATALFWRIQDLVRRWFSFSVPIWTNLVPNRIPISVVVGEPIHFPPSSSSVSKPSSVDECHALYMKKLQELYNEEKGKYGYGDVPLEIL